MIVIIIFTMPHAKASAWKICSRSLSTILIFLLNHPDQHPIATLCFSSVLQLPRLPCLIPAAKARRRCIGRLGEVTALWSSSWSLPGPRWTRPATTAMAREGFSIFECFGSGSGEVMEGVRGAAEFRGFAFGYWVVLAVESSACVLGWASQNSGARNDQTWRGKDMSGKQKDTQNVHWHLNLQLV